MSRIYHLVLILALTFGAVVAPNVSPAEVSDMAIVQMDADDSTEKRSGGCVSHGFTDRIPCKAECTVPWGSSGTAGILPWTPSALLAMSFGIVFLPDAPLDPLGTDPTLDPVPPRLPV